MQLRQASSPGNSNDVSDTSDNGDDTDGNTVDDLTVTVITPRPSIEISKTALVQDQNSNSKTDQADIINYTITVTNTGNVPLNAVNLMILLPIITIIHYQ